MDDREFLNHLEATFKLEAEEHLQAISDGLLALESPATPAVRLEVLEHVFREAHSLKGAARAVNRTDMEALCQSLEGVFASWKRGDSPIPAAGAYDALNRATGALRGMLASPEESEVPGEPDLADISRALHSAARPAAPLARPDFSAPRRGTAPSSPRGLRSAPKQLSTVRIPTTKLDAVLMQAEELRSVKLPAGELAARLRQAQGQLVEQRKWGARLDGELRALLRQSEQTRNATAGTAELRALTQISELLASDRERLKGLETQIAALAALAEGNLRALATAADGLVGEVRQLLMLPFSALMEVFPRAVRDLAQELGKEVDLVVEGTEIEVDRRVLEALKDPLLHLVRNAIDHGLETPEVRLEHGKARRGTLSVAVTPRDGGKIEVTVADDGNGIDPAKVQASAVRLGLIHGEEAAGLSVDETLELVFQSGVSSSPAVTELSGRGLGLAIVREQAERLGGTASVETESGRGTRFSIIVPLTLASFRGVIVRAGAQIFVVPTAQVLRVLKPAAADVLRIGNSETIELDGEPVALVPIQDALEVDAVGDQSAEAPAVLVAVSGKRIAFRVDAILEEQEVLAKPLGPQLTRIRNIAGATVLGDGRLALILHPADLVRSAIRAAARGRPAAAASAAGAPQRKSVLVVEDSITSRMLLKNILQTAGYDVETAIDGVDALARARSGQFDVVISDVEMPRMNGFELTAAIRGDTRLQHLPLILVTSLDSPEARERGMETGANAYVVKSSFDQNTLLDAVRRLA